MSADKKPRKYSNFLRFTGLAFQLGGTIYLGSLLGSWLDENYPNEHMSYFKSLTIFCVFGATYSVIRQVIRMNK